MKHSVITGTGSFLPPLVKKNNDFTEQPFYTEDQLLINSKKEIIIDLDAEQESLTLRRSGKTKFFKDDKEIKAADIPVGTHVTLDATRDGDQKLSALKVMVAPAAAPAGTSVAAPAAAAKATNP